MGALLAVLFGPVKWLIEGLKLWSWARPRQDSLRAQRLTYIRGEDVPQTLTDELELRQLQAAAGWQRIAVLFSLVMTVLSGLFLYQWRTNDADKDKFRQEAINERLNKEAAIRQRDEFVKANRDFAAANGQLQAALSSNNANCRQAITNANVRANLEIDKRTEKKKELIKHATKPKAVGAGEPLPVDPDDLLRAYAQSAPGTDAAVPAANPGTPEDPS